MNQKTQKILKSFFILAMLAFSIKVFATWTSPTSSPLVVNVASPLNVGNVTQSKTGGLVLGGLRVTGPSLFDSSVRIGTSGTNPSGSAVLDLVSTTRGFLAPRVTTTQRNAISTPADGLLIYNTTNQGYEYYKLSATAWTPVSIVTSTFNSDINVNGNIVGRGGGNIGSNTVLGASTLLSNTTGVNNTALGNSALHFNTTGGNNTANGNTALYNNTIGINNTATGFSALWHNTTGNNNTANGYQALSVNTTGVNNTAIGNLADVATNSTSNAIALGSGAIAKDNEFALPAAVTNWKFRGVSYTLPITDGTAGQALTTDGFETLSWATPLPPKMTKAQRTAISSPNMGLIIFQTDNTPGLRVYNGTNWMRFTETVD